MAAKTKKRWEPSLLRGTNLEDWALALSDREEYQGILQFLRDERDRFFGDLRQASTNEDVMKIAGSIATLDEVLQLLDRQ